MSQVVVGSRYKHFKGNTYRVVQLARHTETDEFLVIYMDESTRKYWARPVDQFLSKVDRTKYPDVSQEYRFERVLV